MQSTHSKEHDIISPILIVDASSLFIQQFVANPSLADSGHRKGESTGGIVGFLNGLRHVIDMVMPSRVFVIWESGGSSKRRRLYPEYKQKSRPQKLNRYYEDDLPDSTENRNWQIATLIALLPLVGIGQIYVPDCEADDVIGYLAQYKFTEQYKVILSADKDFYQLLRPDVRIYNPMGRRFVEEANVLERFGVTATNFCVAKAICGDPSDNVPGIAGAGFKTVAKRFPRMGTQEEVTINEIVKEATTRSAEKRSPVVYGRISEGSDIIRRNWKLMNLDLDNLSGKQIKKINHAIDTFAPKRDKMALMRRLMQEGMMSFNVDRFFMTCKAYLTD
jgi:5'-3' exonuclease